MIASESKSKLRIALVGAGQEAISLMSVLSAGSLGLLDVRLVCLVCDDPQDPAVAEARRRDVETVRCSGDWDRLGDIDLVLDCTAEGGASSALGATIPSNLGWMNGAAAGHLARFVRRVREREQESHLERGFARALTYAADEGFMVVDRDYRIVRINEQACRRAGMSASEAEGRYCYQVLRQAVSPCDSPETPCPMLETLATGRSAHAIQDHIYPDGETRYFEVTTYPLVDLEGDLVQVLEVFRDITHDLDERVESRTRSIKDDLAKLVQEDKLIALGKLVASVAHEINNPIGAILNFSKLLLRSLEEGGIPSEEEIVQYQRWLELTASEAERCGKIVGNLLSFARQQSVAARQVDLVELVERMTQLTAHRMELSEIALRLELGADPLYVLGDPNQIQQCIANLIFNALEAMPEGGSLSIRGGMARDRQTVWIEVEDTGEGIAPEHREHIFEPFFTTKPLGQGVGLGLSMVYGILREHGASITCQSTPGEGTRFRMAFPAAGASLEASGGEPEGLSGLALSSDVPGLDAQRPKERTREGR